VRGKMRALKQLKDLDPSVMGQLPKQ